MKAAYVVDGVRTPVGKYGGALGGCRPDDLLALVIRALMARNPRLEPSAIEDVIAGDANQAGEDTRNVARMAALLAGLPVSVPGSTVNRLCASGLQAVIDATRGIWCGDGSVYVAGGVESMTRAPYVMLKPNKPWDRHTALVDTTIGWRFANPRLTAMHPPYSMGETAEQVATRYQVSRNDQDLFALASQEKYFAARAAGRFADEIVPVDTGGREPFAIDEPPRKTSLEKLAALKPAFVKGGTVTAGNSSGLNDGAAALLLADQEAIDRFGLLPLGRVVSTAVAGVDPAIMGMGPLPAIQKALSRAGLALAEIDLIELNEAFAAQSLACIRELGLDPERVNVNGGAIAIGNPLGSSGARISVTLLHEMKRRGLRYGLAAMCVGLGQGAAIIYERC